MKSLGWLTGCALALACAHEGKGIVVESDTKMHATAAEASQPLAGPFRPFCPIRSPF